MLRNFVTNVKSESVAVSVKTFCPLVICLIESLVKYFFLVLLRHTDPLIDNPNHEVAPFIFTQLFEQDRYH